MARVLLALFAILALAFSAGLTHTQLTTPPAPASAALHAIGARQALAADLNYVAPGQAAGLLVGAQTGEEAPQPALLAYLGLVLIGSVVAIGLVRRQVGREI